MTRGQLVYLRTRFESGEPIQALATEADLSVGALQQRWSRADLTGRVVTHSCHRLRSARRIAGLTQTEAAALIGTSERTYRRVESGQIIPPPGRMILWMELLEEKSDPSLPPVARLASRGGVTPDGSLPMQPARS